MLLYLADYLEGLHSGFKFFFRIGRDSPFIIRKRHFAINDDAFFIGQADDAIRSSNIARCNGINVNI